MRVENLVISARATSILTYKPDILSALGDLQEQQTGFKLIKFPCDADEGEEQSGDGGDQQVVQYQHGSAVPTS